MTEAPLDLLVVGAGLSGLQRGRRALAGAQRVLVVERQPQPGGEARTQRSEGFVCELGPFALQRDECTAFADALDRPPPVAELQPDARQGWLWDGSALQPAPVLGAPCSYAGGIEDLVTAYRRELGRTLWLGREVTAVRPPAGPDEVWTAQFGGEAGGTARARAFAPRLPLDAAARLLAPLDPALGDAASRLRREGCAFAFLGTWQDAAAAASLRGYGVLVETAGPVRELLFCSNAFARRAQPGKALVRVELVGPAAAAEVDDDSIARLAEQELRRMTGFSGPVLFRRVHRAPVLVRDGAWTECRTRLRELAVRAPGLDWQPD